MAKKKRTKRKPISYEDILSRSLESINQTNRTESYLIKKAIDEEALAERSRKSGKFERAIYHDAIAMAHYLSAGKPGNAIAIGYAGQRSAPNDRVYFSYAELLSCAFCELGDRELAKTVLSIAETEAKKAKKELERIAKQYDGIINKLESKRITIKEMISKEQEEY
ncbi:MAG: hypothetical protein N3D20_00680 [Candidatus Pacearchaeota archaeon]|nr:hypothetical protein [Candidatus Pacearchaeota archaeon]